MSADRIGIALKGRRNGSGWLVSCPCPNHGKGLGDRSPSLSVTDGDDGRLLLRCFAGCDFIDILDELKRRGIIEDGGKPNKIGVSEAPISARHAPTKHEPDPEALKIWIAARPIQYTPAASYLERRGIAMQPPSLRCGTRGIFATLVAAVQRPDGKIVAVQTLTLTPEGQKASASVQRITTGGLGAGAVRLGPAGKMIGLAEGVESGLSAMQLANIPVWVSLGCERLHRIELPSCVEEIHIFVDNDAPGINAAKRTAELHTGAGRRVNLHYPPTQCGDWNDFINLIADADGRDISEPVSEAGLCDGAEKTA